VSVVGGERGHGGDSLRAIGLLLQSDIRSCCNRIQATRYKILLHSDTRSCKAVAISYKIVLQSDIKTQVGMPCKQEHTHLTPIL
jgi:hypothetical protein